MRALLIAFAVFCCATTVFAQPYNLAQTKTLERVQYAAIDVADYNADGQLDILMAGLAPAAATFSRPLPAVASVWTGLGFGADINNPGQPSFRYVESQLGQALWMASVSFVDLDNDGVLELITSGSSTLEEPYVPVADVFRVTGQQSFGSIGAAITPVYAAASAWLDVDNDGDRDLYLSGAESPGQYRSDLYMNVSGTLTAVPHSLPTVAFGSAVAADLDNDQDDDLIVTGVTSDDKFVTEVLHNEDGSFRVVQNDFGGTGYGSIDLGDIDADGDLDLLIAGATLSAIGAATSTILYLNRGDGTFVDSGESLTGIFMGEARMGDVDNDGDLDIVQSGKTGIFGPPVGQIYANVNGSFSLTSNPCPLQTPTCGPLSPAVYADVVFLDADRDDDLDLMITGENIDGVVIANFYQNDVNNFLAADGSSIPKNFPPAPPFIASEVVLPDGTVTLSWDGASDDRSQASSLSYNVRVGTTPGGQDVMHSGSNLATGERRLVSLGNAGQSESWRLALPAGTYYWSVQSVDMSFAGSAFSPERSFSIP